MTTMETVDSKNDLTFLRDAIAPAVLEDDVLLTESAEAISILVPDGRYFPTLIVIVAFEQWDSDLPSPNHVHVAIAIDVYCVRLDVVALFPSK